MSPHRSIPATKPQPVTAADVRRWFKRVARTGGDRIKKLNLDAGQKEFERIARLVNALQINGSQARKRYDETTDPLYEKEREVQETLRRLEPALSKLLKVYADAGPVPADYAALLDATRAVVRLSNLRGPGEKRFKPWQVGVASLRDPIRDALLKCGHKKVSFTNPSGPLVRILHVGALPAMLSLTGDWTEIEDQMTARRLGPTAIASFFARHLE